MLADAIPSIVQVLRSGTMEARENAAATLFSLSLADENKIIIGTSGAIPALVELLQNGSPRGKKDVANNLFNLCIYQGNKGGAIRAGIIIALLKMLIDSSKSMDCLVIKRMQFAILLALCKRDADNLACISRLGVVIPFTELARNGIERAKRKATSLLEHLRKLQQM
ncbi:hypothetical protein Fmac_006252 [Flemingia macrophylla]|uniref:Uncharacterized protein n=1 Tax=Flemingia macrophylla TaxID=520843 RepID=A0ABD1NA33_9FABA